MLTYGTNRRNDMALFQVKSSEETSCQKSGPFYLVGRQKYPIA
jgi:hypothetical protein